MGAEDEQQLRPLADKSGSTREQCTPNGYEWPVAENYFDVGGVPAQCEFTIMGPMEYACYNYGYLALRASSR